MQRLYGKHLNRKAEDEETVQTTNILIFIEISKFFRGNVEIFIS
jgi:hypothetical protein